MKPLAPNTLLQNRYLVVHLIGKGGMGEVYLAVDQRLGSAVALKRTFFSEDEMLGSAFEREARTLARLRHPVLPKVSDHFTENGLQYLVMEHITGDDLSKRLELTNKPFPINWVLFWADQLLDALAYLHSHEPPIVHRDIKPQNLKLTDENHIVLLDFGLAKNSIGNTKVSSTTGGSIVGYTPHYAPMEQIRGTGTNPRSDIYSFAATFYQLLSNVVPPDALTRADSVLNGQPDPTKPLYAVNPEVPHAIADVIMKGMALSMEQRYATARDMQKAMREAYSQMQSAMAAQTMAFNVNSAPVESEGATIPQQKTEQYSASMMNQAISPQRQDSTEPLISNPFNGGQSANFQSSAGNNSVSSQPANFDATPNLGADSIGMKTDVMPKEKMPNLDSYSSPAPQNGFGKQDSFGQDSFTNKQDNFSSNQDSFSSDQFSSQPRQNDSMNFEQSIPSFVNFNEEKFDDYKETPEKVSEFDSLPKTNGAAAASSAAVASNFVSNQAPAQAESTPVVTPPPVQTQTQKKSGGKGLFIVAGLGGVFILLVAAVAIGWFVLKPSQTSGNSTPAPTPITEPTSAPTTEPTAQPTIETLSTPTVSSSEIVSSTPSDGTTENSTGNTTNPTDTTKNQKTVVTTDKTQPTQQQPNTQPTPAKSAPTPRVVTAKTPAVTAKTPATAKTPSRTDILQ